MPPARGVPPEATQQGDVRPASNALTVLPGIQAPTTAPPVSSLRARSSVPGRPPPSCSSTPTTPSNQAPLSRRFTRLPDTTRRPVPSRLCCGRSSGIRHPTARSRNGGSSRSQGWGTSDLGDSREQGTRRRRRTDVPTARSYATHPTRGWIAHLEPVAGREGLAAGVELPCVQALVAGHDASSRHRGAGGPPAAWPPPARLDR